MPTQKQAELLVKLGKYTYEEIRNWDTGYAGKVIRDILNSKSTKKGTKVNK